MNSTLILYKNKTDTGNNNMGSSRAIGDGFGEQQLQMMIECLLK